MADIKVRFDEMLARRKGKPALPTAVVHPCSEDALAGAIEAAHAGLIEPVLVGPQEKIRQIAVKANWSAPENDTRI
jgi:phosphate acetyltransferase